MQQNDGGRDPVDVNAVRADMALPGTMTQVKVAQCIRVGQVRRHLGNATEGGATGSWIRILD